MDDRHSFDWLSLLSLALGLLSLCVVTAWEHSHGEPRTKPKPVTTIVLSHQDSNTP